MTLPKHKLYAKLCSAVLAASLLTGSAAGMIPRISDAVTLSASAYGSVITDGDYSFSIMSNKTAKIVSYSGNSSAVVVPSTVGEYNVTSIEDDVFMHHNEIRELVISEGIESIGVYSVGFCTNLVNVSLPSTLKTIGYHAFHGCTSLSGIEIPVSVTNIQNHAFEDCKSLKSFFIGMKVSSIGEETFSGCDKLTNIMVNIYNQSYTSREGVLFTKNMEKLCAYPEGKTGSYTIPDKVVTIGAYSFSDCINLTAVTIPDTVYCIEGSAFSGCVQLTEIILPDTSTIIGSNAFSGCINLKKVTLPEGLTNLNPGIFSNCTSLENIKIPSSVYYIGSSAFNNCTSLKQITIPAKVDSFNTDSLSKCSSLEKILVESGNKYYTSVDGVLYRKVYNNNVFDYLSLEKCPEGKNGELVIKETTKLCADNAVTECNKLTKISFPASIKKNGINNIINNPKIGEFSVSEDNNEIAAVDGILFSKDLTELILFPANKATKYTIPDTVTKVCENAFYGNSKISVVVAPLNVANIGNNAFINCTALKSVAILNNSIKIQNKPFKGSNSVIIYGNSGSNAESYAQIYSIPFKTLQPLSNITTLSSESITIGEKIVINAAASGGIGDYKYAVYYKKKTDTKWATAQEYNSNKNISIKPAKAVNYDICVKAIDSIGNVSKKYFTVSVSAELKNTSTISSDVIKLGTKVTLNASAIGGKKPYLYAMYYKKQSDSKWATLQNFVENTTKNLKPAKAVKYDVCIKVKDSEGSIVKKYITLNVTN